MKGAIMSIISAGGHVPTEQEHQDIRESLLVLIDPSLVMVGGEKVQAGLGPNFLEKAVGAKRAMADVLFKLSCTVADLQPPTVDDRTELQSALKLANKVYLPNLNELEKLGTALRGDLEKELVDKLRFNGFLAGSVQKEPALTFQEAAAPIPWEMMFEFEEDLSLQHPWERFWGFRVPITHWVYKSRTPEIRLKRILSAINEDLDFAEEEVNLLTRRLEVELPHTHLAEALKERINQDLGERVVKWWQDHATDMHWLESFVQELQPDPDLRPVDAEKWKEKALKVIFTGKLYDMIHFACHCQPGQQTEYLSCLQMKVAGEQVTLEVGTMAPKMRRELKNKDDPGPLVFLNACGTAKQGMTYQVPGFPDKWINDLGALAVVATICPVPNYFAHEFALKFYDTLFEAANSPGPALARNCFVAEALLTTRRYFMEEFNNPLGLAYVLYTIQDAHVLVDFLALRGTS
jgi:hypothetical protein